MPRYQIIVARSDLREGRGTLRFLLDHAEKFSTPCWEDPAKLIPAKDYDSCSATIMATKGHKSIYLPDDQTGKVGIFVHPGSSPKDSEGCIVCAKTRVEEMYDTIKPKDGRNVFVQVVNPRT